MYFKECALFAINSLPFPSCKFVGNEHCTVHLAPALYKLTSVVNS